MQIVGLVFLFLTMLVGISIFFSSDIISALKSRRRDRLNHALALEKEKTRQKELDLEMYREQQKSVSDWEPPRE